jgi:hypothetical protein
VSCPSLLTGYLADDTIQASSLGMVLSVKWVPGRDIGGFHDHDHEHEHEHEHGLELGASSLSSGRRSRSSREGAESPFEREKESVRSLRVVASRARNRWTPLNSLPADIPDLPADFVHHQRLPRGVSARESHRDPTRIHESRTHLTHLPITPAPSLSS